MVKVAASLSVACLHRLDKGAVGVWPKETCAGTLSASAATTVTLRLPGVSSAAPPMSIVLDVVLDVGGVQIAPGWIIPSAGGVSPSVSHVRFSVAKRSVENE